MSQSSVSTVEKALLLLEELATARRPVSLAEVTVAVGLPKPTAYRLLRSMQNLGYVSRPVGSRDYVIGPRAARLSANDPYTELKAAAKPLLRRLHGELNETVNLGVISGAQVLYIDFLETTQPLRYIVTPGENDAFQRTALGRAVAAQLTEEQFEALLQSTSFGKAISAAAASTARERLRRVVEETRERGYAEEHEEAAQGVACLAVGLAFLGFPQAALSVAIPVHRFTPEMRERAIRALHKISRL